MSEESSRGEAFQACLDKALVKVNAAIDQAEPGEVANLAKLASALVDLAALLGLKKDDLDREEQKAKIDQIKAKTEHDTPQSGGGVLVLPAFDDPE